MNIVYQKASYSKRLFAAALDLAIHFVAVSLIWWGLSSALPFMPFYKNAISTYDSIQLESGLYVKSGDNIITIEEKYKGEESYTVKNEAFENALLGFYQNPAFFSDPAMGLSQYNAQKVGDQAIVDAEGTPYWMRSGEAIVKREGYTDEKMNEFYVKALDEKARGYIGVQRSEYVTASRIIAYSGTLAIPVAINISVLIFNVILPLAWEGGRGKKTIGKAVFHLAVLDVHALSPRWYHHLGRSIFMLLIEVDLSLVAFAIPLIVSFSMAVFSKRGQSLHDYVANTYVVSTAGQSVYVSAEEYSMAMEKLDGIDIAAKGGILAKRDGD